jgi:chromosome segregation ATPase
VLANSWVDSTFLDKADQQRHLAMENFQGELREIDTLGQNQKEAEAHIREVQQSLFEHERIYGETKAELDILDRLIAVDDKNLKTLIQAAGGLCTTWDVLQRCPDKVKNAKIELDDKKKTRSALADELEALRGKLVDQRDEIACAEKRQRGENCKFWDRLPDTPNIALVQQKLNDLNTSVSDFAENTINLLVSLLLKTVAIPLVFIYLLLMIVRMNWKRV